MPVSASRTTRRRRVRSLPAGMNRAAGAGWERPRTPQPSPGISPDSGAVDRTIGGGSLPAPLSAPKRGVDSEACDRNARGPTSFETHGTEKRVAEVVAEGGVDFRYSESGPDHDPGDGKLLARVGRSAFWSHATQWAAGKASTCPFAAVVVPLAARRVASATRDAILSRWGKTKPSNMNVNLFGVSLS